MGSSEAGRSIYLAGPEVFLPDAREIGDGKKRICETYGFEGVFPLDRLPEAEVTDPEALARQIFQICIDMMDDSDMIVANLTPFRGISVDPGTAVELGYMYARGKPAFGYTNVVHDYRQRARVAGLLVPGEVIEDFGLADNLMCEGVIRWPRESWAIGSGAPVIRTEVRAGQLFSCLDGFAASVQLARRYLDEGRLDEGRSVSP
jgi:nucleoside 2-deoxyribosyltransferase